MYQIIDNVERDLCKTDCDYQTAVRFHFSEVYFHEQAVVTGQWRSSNGMSLRKQFTYVAFIARYGTDRVHSAHERQIILPRIQGNYG